MNCAQDEKFPKVREEILDLADKLGVDYGTAKVIYESNNGYGLDKAPSGAESNLYKTLLEHYGDELRALIAKARTHLAPFKNWFGDWTSEDTTNVSKVVDENGEPLVVFHTTHANFNFDDYLGLLYVWGDLNFHVFDTMAEGRLTAIYFTDDYNMSYSYVEGKLEGFETYELRKLNGIERLEYLRLDLLGFKEILSREKEIIDNINKLPESDRIPKRMRPTNLTLRALMNYHRLLNAKKRLPLVEKTIKDIELSLARLEKHYKEHPEQFTLPTSDTNSSPFTRAFFLNLKNPVEIEGFGKNWNRLKDVNETLSYPDYKRLNKLESVNRKLIDEIEQETVKTLNQTYKKNRTYLQEYFELEDDLIEDPNSDFGNVFRQAEKQALSVIERKYGRKILDSGELFNLVELYYKRFKKELDALETHSTRSLELKYLRSDNGYDGVITYNVTDYGFKKTPFAELEPANVYAVKNPNDIKSIDNNGNFSTATNDMYEVVIPETGLNPISQQAYQDIFSTPTQGRLTADKVLSRMINTSEFFQDPIQSEVAAQISKVLESEVIVEVTENAPYTAAFVMRNGKPVVRINAKAFLNLNTHDVGRAFLHEIVHYFTIHKYKTDEKFRNKIDKLHAELLSKVDKDLLKDPMYYGLKSSEEFITELFTNSAFRDFVVKNKSKSIWRKIVEAIAKILGIQPRVSKFLDSKMPSTVDKTVKEISNIINNFYSDPTISNYGDAIAYLSPTDPRYDAIKRAADQIILKARTGLNSRLSAMKHNKDATPAQVAKLKTQIERYENMLRVGEDQSVIIDFIKESSIVFKSTLDKIRNAYANPDLMTNEEVWAMRSDIIEFYGPIIGQINSELLTPGYFEDLSLDDRKLLARRLHLIQAVYAEVKGKWKYIIQEKAKNIIRNYSEAYGIPKDVVEAYCDDFLNHTSKDIWFYGKFLQSTKSMDELAVRIMHRAMTDCNNQSTRYANEKAHELIQVLMPVRRHWDDFYEKDSKGRRTGMLVRDRKYGQAMRELQTFLDRLDAKYGIKDRQYQLLEGDDYINYCVEKEKYIGDHFERRFKKEYYEAYAKLSLYAKEVLRGFNQEIDLITSPVTRNDGIHLEDLSDENYKKLLSLYREKRNLSNNYYEDGTSKVGLDLDLALELQEFEKVTKGGIFSKQLTLDEVLAIIEEKKNTLTEEQFKKWYDRNVTVAYSESFTLLLKLNSKDRIEEYQELLDIRSQLLRYGRNSKNPYVAAGLLTESAKAEILDIDNALEDFRADLEEEGTTSSFRLSDFVKFETTQEYERDKAAASAAGPEAYQEWYNRSHTSKGRPASYYTKMIPIDPAHFEVRLNRMNRELSENSPLYNPDYDSSSSEHYQPKRSLYDNSKAFDKIRNNPMMQLAYDYILDLMLELNSKINYLENANNYKLPQISGDLYDHVVKGKNWKGIFHYIDDSTAVRSDDEQYALENYTARADGSLLDFVPTPYVSNLTRPEYISSNLIGILTEYARMAENFRIKNDTKGDFLVIEEILKQRDFVDINEITGTKTLKSGDKTRIYDRYHSFLEMLLWNRFKKPVMNSTNKYLLRLTLVMHILKDHATKQNLSWNPLTIIKSFFQGLYKSIVEALAGRYLDTAHYFTFMALSWLTLPVLLWNLSRPTTNNFDIALLHHNQISRETKSLTENILYNRLVRGVKSNIIWGGWSFVDYMTKLPVVKSVYANFKYDPVSGTFMARHQYINKYYGDDRAAGKRAFKRLKVRAIDAITSKDGVIVMKDKYKHLSDAFFNPNVQNSLRNISKFLTNRIDGMLSPEDKTQIMTDSILGWAFMHRSFWVNNLEDNYMANRQYNPMLEDEYEAKFQSLFKPLWLMGKNLIIAGQNTMRRAAGRTDLKAYHTFKPDSLWRYNVSKVLMQWGGIILISILLSSWLKEKANELEDNVFVLTLVTALEGMVNEEVAEYPSTQFLNQVSNFSPGLSPMLNWFNLGVAIANWGSSTDEFNIYESGAYEGFKPIHRSLIRVTPGLKGLIESKDIRSRKRYIEKNRAGVIQWFYTDEFNAEDDWEQHEENMEEYQGAYDENNK